MQIDNSTLALLIGGPAAMVAIMATVGRLRGVQLRHRFAYLGNPAGKTLHEIVAAVGAPSARTKLAGNSELIQWQRPGYIIALVFADSVCQGTQHESTA